MSEHPPSLHQGEPIPEIESREQLVSVACERLLARHQHSHNNLPFHNEAHPQAVMERVQKIAKALSVPESSTEYQAALLAAAGHDVVIHSSLNSETGRLVRTPGGTQEFQRAGDDPNTTLNEYESARAIIETLQQLDPQKQYWDNDLADRIVAAVDATVPTVKPEPISEDLLRVHQPRTDAEIDLSQYALTLFERPHALAIRRPYLTHQSELPSVMLALADLSHIGAEEYETFQNEGNAEFRELEADFRINKLPALSEMNAMQRATFVEKMFNWWKVQILLPIQQKQLFLELFDQNSALIQRPSEQRERLFDLFSKFEANALKAAEFYEQMLADYGDLRNPANHTVDSIEPFRELLEHMGYEIPQENTQSE